MATSRVSPADAESLGQFFELLANDDQTRRFFHPHPLTRAFAAQLSKGACQDRYYLTRYLGHIAGYSMLRGWDEGYETPSFGGCTHPELRGAWLGHFLLAHAIGESQAAGASQLRLTVYKTNASAIHIYRKFGFAFSDKNQEEWIGFLDLRSAAIVCPCDPDAAKLNAWLKRQQ